MNVRRAAHDDARAIATVQVAGPARVVSAAVYDVEESARRLAAYRPVLRELVHLTAGHLALEPRLDRKTLLGDHLHDDARAVAKLDGRLAELGGAHPVAPGPEVAAVLDRAARADSSGYLEVAYGELKPALVAAIREHLDGLDPLADEPSLRLLTQLLHRQERHVAELPATGAPPPLTAAPGDPRELIVMPPIERPRRDAFVAAGDGGHPVHDLLNAELCAAELAARTSHEHPELPLAFHVDMARLCWDHVRHAELLDRVLATELGSHWGEHPVSVDAFTTAYADDLDGRLAALAREPVTEGVPAATAAFIRADAAAHAAIVARRR
jgi:uncharacterized ferritin-like protein (DUF455 family)